jgi:hypothetical protein
MDLVERVLELLCAAMSCAFTITSQRTPVRTLKRVLTIFLPFTLSPGMSI